MKWTDTTDIVLALIDAFPDTDPIHLRFTELMTMVMTLPGFDDVENRCNEKILEAIQTAWIGER